MWKAAGKTTAVRCLRNRGVLPKPSTLPLSTARPVSDPRATLGISGMGSHIHIPYYCLKRDNQREEA
jgi:hypothetical protein